MWNQLSKYYDISYQIGQGSFGSVYLAYKKGTLEKVAIKVVEFKKLEFEELQEYVRAEISLIASLDKAKDNYIIEYHDQYIDENGVALVIEYCPANLADLCYQFFPEGISEFLVLKLMTQLLTALCYLHHEKIIHRDLKLENIMLAVADTLYERLAKRELTPITFLENCQLRLIDFGVSRKLLQSDATTYTGSSQTMAPEIVNNQVYNNTADIFSAGVIFYQLLTGKQLKKHSKFNQYISKPQLINEDKNLLNISTQTKNIISFMIALDVNQRKSAEELLQLFQVKQVLFSHQFENSQTIQTNGSQISSVPSNIQFKQGISHLDSINPQSQKKRSRIILINDHEEEKQVVTINPEKQKEALKSDQKSSFDSLNKCDSNLSKIQYQIETLMDQQLRQFTPNESKNNDTKAIIDQDLGLMKQENALQATKNSNKPNVQNTMNGHQAETLEFGQKQSQIPMNIVQLSSHINVVIVKQRREQYQILFRCYEGLCYINPLNFPSPQERFRHLIYQAVDLTNELIRDINTSNDDILKNEWLIVLEEDLHFYKTVLPLRYSVFLYSQKIMDEKSKATLFPRLNLALAKLSEVEGDYINKIAIPDRNLRFQTITHIIAILIIFKKVNLQVDNKILEEITGQGLGNHRRIVYQLLILMDMDIIYKPFEDWLKDNNDH